MLLRTSAPALPACRPGAISRVPGRAHCADSGRGSAGRMREPPGGSRPPTPEGGPLEARGSLRPSVGCPLPTNPSGVVTVDMVPCRRSPLPSSLPPRHSRPGCRPSSLHPRSPRRRSVVAQTAVARQRRRRGAWGQCRPPAPLQPPPGGPREGWSPSHPYARVLGPSETPATQVTGRETDLRLPSRGLERDQSVSEACGLLSEPTHLLLALAIPLLGLEPLRLRKKFTP